MSLTVTVTVPAYQQPSITQVFDELYNILDVEGSLYTDHLSERILRWSTSFFQGLAEPSSSGLTLANLQERNDLTNDEETALQEILTRAQAQIQPLRQMLVDPLYPNVSLREPVLDRGMWAWETVVLRDYENCYRICNPTMDGTVLSPFDGEVIRETPHTFAKAMLVWLANFSMNGELSQAAVPMSEEHQGALVSAAFCDSLAVASMKLMFYQEILAEQVKLKYQAEKNLWAMEDSRQLLRNLELTLRSENIADSEAHQLAIAHQMGIINERISEIETARDMEVNTLTGQMTDSFAQLNIAREELSQGRIEAVQRQQEIHRLQMETLRLAAQIGEVASRSRHKRCVIS